MNSSNMMISVAVALLAPATALSVQFGSQAGEYNLGRVLGQGGFGVVKEGIHRATGEKRAVKIVDRKTLRKIEDGPAQLQMEVNLQQAVKHPNVVRLDEKIDTASHHYLIMEQVQGKDLFDVVVESGKLSEEKARFYFKQLMDGVEAMHKSHVVHRDIKLENVMVSDSDEVKLVDFGLGDFFTPGKKLTAPLKGTLHTMAPEVINVPAAYEAAPVDIWSSGAVLYMMVEGRSPFDAQKVATTMSRIRLGQYYPPRFMSETLKDLVAKMLTVDVSQRITMEEIRAHPWFLGYSTMAEWAEFAAAELQIAAQRQANAQRITIDELRAHPMLAEAELEKQHSLLFPASESINDEAEMQKQASLVPPVSKSINEDEDNVENWITTVKDGKEYYFNFVTAKATFERPTCMPKEEPATPRLSSASLRG